MSSTDLEIGSLEYYYYYYPDDNDNDGLEDYLEYYYYGDTNKYPFVLDQNEDLQNFNVTDEYMELIQGDTSNTVLNNIIANIFDSESESVITLQYNSSLSNYILLKTTVDTKKQITVKLVKSGESVDVSETTVVYSPLEFKFSGTQDTNTYKVFESEIKITPSTATTFNVVVTNDDIKYKINDGIETSGTTDGIAKNSTIVFCHLNYHNCFNLILGSVTSWVTGNELTLNFRADLYMAGNKLQAEPVPMYELKDVVNNPFAIGNSDDFKSEYMSNPDILVEDISEFLQGIDKLENLMKQLSTDNRQRDPDTEFCCEGKPPPGGKPSC